MEGWNKAMVLCHLDSCAIHSAASSSSLCHRTSAAPSQAWQALKDAMLAQKLPSPAEKWRLFGLQLCNYHLPGEMSCRVPKVLPVLGTPCGEMSQSYSRAGTPPSSSQVGVSSPHLTLSCPALAPCPAAAGICHAKRCHSQLGKEKHAPHGDLYQLLAPQQQPRLQVARPWAQQPAWSCAGALRRLRTRDASRARRWMDLSLRTPKDSPPFLHSSPRLPAPGPSLRLFPGSKPAPGSEGPRVRMPPALTPQQGAASALSRAPR